MHHTCKQQRSLADLGLGPATTAQLDELARHHDRSLDQAATMAIHIAYLAHLDDKRNAAMRALNEALGRSHIDDEIPF
ncbi:hypothetical protein [uncultured Roseobacter sp.]|uniref:hypothetical protein n=1 Tax=uncultured Roseobacter sp. TaxID=114847 RepID=UPI0026340FCD|nr:hypothetical protein [uncultured Roseobacter sp.]